MQQPLFDGVCSWLESLETVRWSVGSWKWKLVYAAKSFLASWLIWKKPDKLPLFILSKSKCHWASVAVQHLCFCSLHFVRVCLRLPSKFCQLWRKSSIFHLLASVQHRQLSLKEPFLTDSQPVTSAAAESHPPQFFRPSVIHPDVDAGAWSRAAATSVARTKRDVALQVSRFGRGRRFRLDRSAGEATTRAQRVPQRPSKPCGGKKSRWN